MKSSYGIKNYMGVQEEGMGVEEEFVQKFHSLMIIFFFTAFLL